MVRREIPVSRAFSLLRQLDSDNLHSPWWMLPCQLAPVRVVQAENDWESGESAPKPELASHSRDQRVWNAVSNTSVVIIPKA